MTSGYYFGREVASIPDVDGDGRDDIVVGSYDDQACPDPRQGRAYVYSGRTGDLVRVYVSRSLEESGAFGNWVGGSRDLDGDGLGDVLVTAHTGYLPPSPPASGRAHVFSGGTADTLFVLQGRHESFASAFGVLGARSIPDCDGDGVDDIGVGAYAEENFMGHAYIFSGATGALLHELSAPNPGPNGNFGLAVAGAGDVDGDGAGDLLVASVPRMDPWRIYIVSGRTGEIIRAVSGVANALRGGSDLDRDGVPDIVAAVSNATLAGQPANSGAVWLYSGATGELIRAIGSPNPISGGSFGCAIDIIADMDGDGVADLVVGAFGEISMPPSPPSGGRGGVVYVISSATGEAIATLRSPRNIHGGHFGEGVAALPDTNGDGRPEIVASAPGESDQYHLPAQVYLFLSCRADWNGDGVVNSADFFAFLVDFFAGTTDLNADGVVNSQDFFDFVNDFFEGCDQ